MVDKSHHNLLATTYTKIVTKRLILLRLVCAATLLISGCTTKTKGVENVLDQPAAVSGVQNRPSFIFSPSDLNSWIAIPPDAYETPASFGPYIGFNLRHELYGSGDDASPNSFPAQ
jgi:hypothetical protein